MIDSKWDTPSRFFIVNLEEKKLHKEVELRGFNFYSPQRISKNEVFVSISTGDIISISLETGKINYISEFPEPFISNTFIHENQYCTLGVMGMLLCFKKTKGSYGITLEKRYFETPIGRIGEAIEGKLYVPSRLGFFNL